MVEKKPTSQAKNETKRHQEIIREIKHDRKKTTD